MVGCPPQGDPVSGWSADTTAPSPSLPTVLPAIPESPKFERGKDGRMKRNKKVQRAGQNLDCFNGRSRDANSYTLSIPLTKQCLNKSGQYGEKFVKHCKEIRGKGRGGTRQWPATGSYVRKGVNYASSSEDARVDLSVKDTEGQ